MTPDWTAISTRVTQIIEVLHLVEEPLACTALDHCQRRAAGEPAGEAGADQLLPRTMANRSTGFCWAISIRHPPPVRDRAL